MTTSRRRFLKLLGGGVILGAAGATGFATTRTPTAALAPWQTAGGYDDPRKQALSYAILAPNAHNRQPWVVGLHQDADLTLWRDPDRDLPHTDPFNRQLVISLGCFIELFSIAASQTGHSVQADLFPQGEAGPVAQMRLLPDSATPDALFAHVLDRRSCKEPFTQQVVADPLAMQLSEFGTVHTDPAMVETLRDLAWAAWLTEIRTPRTLHESIDLMRFGKAEINASPDGIDLGGPFLETLMLTGMLTRAAQRDPSSQSAQQAVARYKSLFAATPAFISLATNGNTRPDQIAAGRRWMRLNLTTTALGLALHPVSQCLQEFPEMADHYAQAHSLMAKSGETVQMLGRLGYGPATPRRPRWPMETILTDA